MLYFAYGSNMSLERLKDRGICAKRVGCYFTLRKYTLKFHKKSIDGSGKCNIDCTDKERDFVIGRLFKIDDCDRNKLDKFEGCGKGKGYERRAITIDSEKNEITIKGRECQNEKEFTYVAIKNNKNINDSLKPYTWYKYHVLRGAKEGGFPASYINFIKGIEDKKDSCKQREKCELSTYRDSDDYIDCEKET